MTIMVKEGRIVGKKNAGQGNVTGGFTDDTFPQAVPAPKKKRGRGRPKGSKNKPKF